MFSHLRLHEWYQQHHLPKDKPFFVFVDENAKEIEKLSFNQLDQHALSISAQLSKLADSKNGVSNTPLLSPGDAVVLMCPPSLEFMKLFMGCLYAGLIVVPVSPPAVPLFRRNSNKNNESPSAAMEAAWGSLDNIIRDSGAKLGLTTNSLLSILQTVKYDPNFSEERYNGLYGFQWETVDTNNVFQIDSNENSSKYQPTDDTVAMIQYSSGSTGKPKGVILSHNNIFQNCQMMMKFVGSTQEEVSVSWLPMYHDMGLMGHFFSPLLACPKLQVITSPLTFLQKPLIWLALIHKYRATVSGGPNFAYSLLSNRYRFNATEALQKLDLSSWRVAYCGAEPVRPSTLHSFVEVFKTCKFNPNAFFPVYGMAEAVLLISYRHTLEDETRDSSTDARVLKISRAHLAKKTVKVVAQHGLHDFRFGGEGINEKDQVSVISLGRPANNTNLLIVDPTSRKVCPEGFVGEIWVSNPCVSVGYWRKPELSSHAFHGFTSDNKGPFLRTGDLGFLWQGELYFTSRLKDLIIINGKNYAPQDIEDTVENSHPLLRIGCTAVFSVTTDELNHSPQASRHASLTKLQRKAEAENGYHDDSRHIEQLCIVSEVKRTHIDSEMIQTIKKNVQQAVFERHNLPVNTTTNLILVHAATVPKTTSGKIKRSETKQLFLDGKITEISGEIDGSWLRKMINIKNFVVFIIYEYFMWTVFLMLFVWNSFNTKYTQTKQRIQHAAGMPKRVVYGTIKKLQLKYEQSQVTQRRPTQSKTTKPQQREENSKELTAPIEKHLISVIQDQMQITGVDAETSFAQYGMKSVDAVEIASKLQEHYGKKIHPTCFYEFYNVQKLAQFILQSDESPINEIPKEAFLSKSLSGMPLQQTRSPAYILGLGTANPPHKLSQADLLHLLVELSNSITENANSLHKVKKLFNNSGIDSRYLCLPPSVLAKLDSIEERNNHYVQLAPALAAEAAQKALQDWGGDKSLITHVISVSCTGTIVPGLEYHIMERLGLDSNVTRLGLNFMGCFGGLAGLRTAQSIALSDPRHRVLVVCTELCSLQVQMDDIRNDNLVADTLFGDGAAAVVVGSNPLRSERPFYEIVKSACHAIPRTEDRIQWCLSNTGWKVGLHPDIGFLLGQNIKGFCEALCETEKVQMDENIKWAIHPGGKSIIELIEQKMNLGKEQTDSTWKTYLQKGNMSSATILFVLEEMRNSSKHNGKNLSEPVVSLAFGPGLSIEGVLLKK